MHLDLTGVNLLEIDLPDNIVKDLIILSNQGDCINLKNTSIIEDETSIKEIISKFINIDSFFASTLFNHTEPFTIHSDINDKKKSILLIPIDAHKEQKFVVFDQTINQDNPISWIYNIFDDKTDQELEEMYYHHSLKCRPCDTLNVQGCTDLPVSEDLYAHLPYSKDFYYGLTGHVWNYTPGKALLFDANKLHATGRMYSPKIGCTVQFTDSINNLEILTKTQILP